MTGRSQAINTEKYNLAKVLHKLFIVPLCPQAKTRAWANTHKSMTISEVVNFHGVEPDDLGSCSNSTSAPEWHKIRNPLIVVRQSVPMATSIPPSILELGTFKRLGDEL